MTLSAFGAVLMGVMWSAIALLRSPNPLNSSPDKTPGAHPSPRSPGTSNE